jgi:uncharacterized RDD family membrane protein YckC
MSDFNPYEAPAAIVADPVGTEFLELADRGTRLGAKILDGFILGGGIAIIGIIAAIAIPALLSQRRGGAFPTVFFAAFGVVAGGLMIAIMIWNLVWLHRYGQTIAKRILKIRIVRSNGDKVGMGRVVGLRIVVMWVIEMIPLLGPLFSLVNICFIFRDDRRCIHDLLADTIVVKMTA